MLYSAFITVSLYYMDGRPLHSGGNAFCNPLLSGQQSQCKIMLPLHPLQFYYCSIAALPSNWGGWPQKTDSLTRQGTTWLLFNCVLSQKEPLTTPVLQENIALHQRSLIQQARILHHLSDELLISSQLLVGQITKPAWRKSLQQWT